ncbi:MAG: cyclic nucleotide-binding domain-containing protein [Candidatus Riflebacteria bacterium]|nr:cyclic nucleotide-binding domain-containing protein [Candidatus Riflebacteria bacterium]
MLKMLSIFSDLNSSEIDQVAQIVSEISVQRGTTIFQQGEISRDFYIVKHGQVEISVKDFYQVKRVIAILKNGEFFGEMSLFDKDAARSATAQAFQNTTLYKIPGNAFESLLEDRPSICFKLLGTMSKRLRDMINPVKPSPTVEKVKNGKVMTIASARSGYGKTVMATTLASLLSYELPRKVLFLDLDLNFGDGSFLMGVYAPINSAICGFAWDRAA